MPAFLDTNILVYCVDESESSKRPKALALLRQLLTEAEPVCISTQVAVEFMRWVSRERLPAVNSQNLLDTLTPFACQPTTISLVRSAWALAQDHTISWFDALIVQAALDARCTTLYSEDLQHGRRFGTLEIVNPFQ
ncbi:MAG TPA: PIN domain-containing protein [Casimicrobium sp.]|nr:PIN domain-containing protein [Casimicrobium sp.]